MSDLPENKKAVRFMMHVLWPAFVGAVIAVGILFSLIDPDQVDSISVYLGGSREAAYTVGFVVLWLLFSFACSLTWFLVSTERRPNG